jgi:hypothetical protein
VKSESESEIAMCDRMQMYNIMPYSRHPDLNTVKIGKMFSFCLGKTCVRISAGNTSTFFEVFNGFIQAFQVDFGLVTMLLFQIAFASLLKKNYVVRRSFVCDINSAIKGG